MVKTNFTIAGNAVRVIARVGEERTAVYDLEIGLETIFEGLSYGELVMTCDRISAELRECTSFLYEAGESLYKFNEQHKGVKLGADGE